MLQFSFANIDNTIRQQALSKYPDGMMTSFPDQIREILGF